jgi:hypothetical protein
VSKPDRAELCDADRDRLDRIEQLLGELVRKRKVANRAGRKRGRTVAERAAAEVRYRPTELQMAAARKRVRAG